MKFKTLVQVFSDAWKGFKLQYLSSRRDHFAEIGDHSVVLMPFWGTKQNVHLDDYVSIGENATIISTIGHLYVHKYTSIAKGLTAICQSHHFFEVGDFPCREDWGSNQIRDDVVIEGGCWIGANVTLCPGTRIPRGCLVAANAVCVKGGEYYPYTVIAGCPARVIKYRFNLEQQIEHEKIVLPENERLSAKELQEYYSKFNANN